MINTEEWLWAITRQTVSLTLNNFYFYIFKRDNSISSAGTSLENRASQFIIQWVTKSSVFKLKKVCGLETFSFQIFCKVLYRYKTTWLRDTTEVYASWDLIYINGWTCVCMFHIHSLKCMSNFNQTWYIHNLHCLFV